MSLSLSLLADSSLLLSLALQNHGPFCGHCLVRYWWSQGLPLEGIACPLCRANAHCLCAPKGTMARGLDLRGRLVGLAISAYNALVRFHPWINVAKAIFVLGFAVSATTYFYESFTNFFYRNWVPSMLIVLIASYMRRHYLPESLAVRIILEGW